MERVARVMGMNCTLSGMSSRNLSTWQSLVQHVDLGILLRASGTVWSPAFAELCLNLMLLLLTHASSCWSLELVECFPSLILLAAYTTGLLSGITMVVLWDSLIQCRTWSMANTAPTPSFSHGDHPSM